MEATLTFKTLIIQEDDFLRASDADLDAKLTLFASIRGTSEKLLHCVDEYQAHIIGEGNYAQTGLRLL